MSIIVIGRVTDRDKDMVKSYEVCDPLFLKTYIDQIYTIMSSRLMKYNLKALYRTDKVAIAMTVFYLVKITYTIIMTYFMRKN